MSLTALGAVNRLLRCCWSAHCLCASVTPSWLLLLLVVVVVVRNYIALPSDGTPVAFPQSWIRPIRRWLAVVSGAVIACMLVTGDAVQGTNGLTSAGCRAVLCSLSLTQQSTHASIVLCWTVRISPACLISLTIYRMSHIFMIWLAASREYCHNCFLVMILLTITPIFCLSFQQQQWVLPCSRIVWGYWCFFNSCTVLAIVKPSIDVILAQLEQTRKTLLTERHFIVSFEGLCDVTSWSCWPLILADYHDQSWLVRRAWCVHVGWCLCVDCTQGVRQSSFNQPVEWQRSLAEAKIAENNTIVSAVSDRHWSDRVCLKLHLCPDPVPSALWPTFTQV